MAGNGRRIIVCVLLLAVVMLASRGALAGVMTTPATEPACDPLNPVVTLEPGPCSETVSTGSNVTVKCCVTPVSQGWQLTLSRRSVMPGSPAALMTATIEDTACSTYCVSEELDGVTTSDWGEYYCNLHSHTWQETRTFLIITA